MSYHLEKFTEACHQAGLRVTHQRLEVYRALTGTDEHPSAESVYQQVRDRLPTISLDTVYRTLATLADIGAISRMDVAGERARFDGNIAPHQHFVCDRCSRIMDFPWESFDVLSVPTDAGRLGRISGRSAVLRGICANCEAKESSSIS
jgi:Fur family peroxide stress response transcriptional regulator